MTTFNRFGLAITIDQWRKLFADPAYRMVKRTEVGRWVVETSWVGVCTSVEQTPPKLFLVETKPAGSRDGVANTQRGQRVWAATEEAALQEHGKALATLKGEKRG